MLAMLSDRVFVGRRASFGGRSSFGRASFGRASRNKAARRARI